MAAAGAKNPLTNPSFQSQRPQCRCLLLSLSKIPKENELLHSDGILVPLPAFTPYATSKL
jgi:hypothetical protein